MARMPTLFVSHGSPLLAVVDSALILSSHDDEPGVRIHASYDRRLPSLDAYAFGLAAPAARESRVRAATASPPPLH